MAEPLSHPITALRKELGLSKTQFADRCSIDRTVLSKVEHGWRHGFGHETNAQIEKKLGRKGLAAQLDAFRWPIGATGKLRAQEAARVLSEFAGGNS